MDWPEFQAQAHSLSRACSDFPHFQWRLLDSGSALPGQQYLQMRSPRAAAGLVGTVTVSVVWSPAYRVPVLYFRASDLQGVPLSVEEVRRLVLAQEASEVDASLRWGLVSPAEHPVTGEPYYSVHPCESASLLGPNRQLTRWMSVALQVLGVRFPLRLAATLPDYGDCPNQLQSQ